MTTDRTHEYLISLINELRKLPKETEWVEFKLNDAEPDDIGEYLSALANSAALCGKAFAYLVWGIENSSHDIVDTKFSPSAAKVGNEELESWLLRLLSPKIHFRFFEFEINGASIVLLEIGRAFRHPVQFKGLEFIRVGSYKKRLKEFPEKERELWRIFDQTPFEKLVVNALIHQDFFITGSGPMVEIFDNRIEITNPGKPLVQTERFLDTPPRSRNEALASFMRRIGVCEERGSGVDKVVFQTEYYQLPAPAFEAVEDNTKAVLFAHKPLAKMDKADRIRACYLHACLRYVNRDYMTNTSLRERFGIEPKNSATVSRYIKEAIKAGLIHSYDESAARKMQKYVPFWA